MCITPTHNNSPLEHLRQTLFHLGRTDGGYSVAVGSVSIRSRHDSYYKALCWLEIGEQVLLCVDANTTTKENGFVGTDAPTDIMSKEHVIGRTTR